MSPNYTSLQDVTSVHISQITSWEARKGLSTSLSPKHTKDSSPQEVQKFVSIYFKKWEQDSATRFWVQRYCSKHWRPDYPNPLAPMGTVGAVLRTVALPAFVSWEFLWLSQASRGICTWSYYCSVSLFQHGKREEAWPQVSGCTWGVPSALLSGEPQWGQARSEAPVLLSYICLL